MELEKAIKTAIEYETKVRDVYKDAADNAADSTGQMVFQTLAREEQYHLDYLNERLNEWQKTGKISVEKVKTLVPPQDIIDENVQKLNKQLAKKSNDKELQMLNKALKVEEETSAFYKSLVDKISGDGQKMFARFVEIEEGHQAIVKAEIDALSGSGFWFDFNEFSLEKEL